MLNDNILLQTIKQDFDKLEEHMEFNFPCYEKKNEFIIPITNYEPYDIYEDEKSYSIPYDCSLFTKEVYLKLGNKDIPLSYDEFEEVNYICKNFYGYDDDVHIYISIYTDNKFENGEYIYCKNNLTLYTNLTNDITLCSIVDRKTLPTRFLSEDALSPSDLVVKNSLTVGSRSDNNIGEGSFSSGYQTKASGKNSHAEGNETIASGSYSHAEGNETKASGKNSHAEGNSTIASGDYSHAEGGGTIASGDYSHAEGWDTKASVFCSHAEGYSTEASGNESHAEGSETKASGYCSHAEGSETKASGRYSHAEGWDTKASGSYSHAEGCRTIASGENQHVQGQYNIEDTNNKYAHIVGNGENLMNRSNAHTLDWNGNGWYKGKLSQDGTPANDKDLTTKKYVDDKFNSLPQLSFNEEGELVVSINGVTKIFVPKSE